MCKAGYTITSVFLISEAELREPRGYVPHKKRGQRDVPYESHFMVLQKTPLGQISEIFSWTHSLEDDFVSSGVFVSWFLHFTLFSCVGKHKIYTTLPPNKQE